MLGVRHRERRAVPAVEAGRHGAGEFQVLALVVADRHPVRVVQQDVRRHQDRVRQQGQPDVRLPGALLLELDHPLRLPVPGHALEQVVQLGVRGHVGLHVQQARVGVNAGGEKQCGVLEGAHDQDDRVDLALGVHHGADRAEVVAQLQRAGRFEAGESARHCRFPSEGPTGSARRARRGNSDGRPVRAAA